MMEIPEIIQQRLVCYVTVVADGYMTLPDKIAGIQGLRVLEGLSVYTQSTEFLEGLGSLKNLRKLGIRFIYHHADADNWEKKQEEVVFSINKLGKASLESLHILIKGEGMGVFEKSWLTCPLPSWFPCPPYGLRELVIEHFIFEGFPAWMESLINLEKLSLLMENGEKRIEILGDLRSLCYLSIGWADDDGKEVELAIARAMEAHPNRPTLAWTYM
jgi:disease resistance protein RPM1